MTLSGGCAIIQPLSSAVADAELAQGLGRAAGPFRHAGVAEVPQVGDADGAGPEAGGDQVAEAAEEGGAGLHLRTRPVRPGDVVEHRAMGGPAALHETRA